MSYEVFKKLYGHYADIVYDWYWHRFRQSEQDKIEEEMANALAAEISAEIDKEIMADLKKSMGIEDEDDES